MYHVVYKILWWLCSQQIQINIGCMENTCMENIHTGELAHVLVSDLLVCRVSSLSKAFSQCISPGLGTRWQLTYDQLIDMCLVFV